MATVNASVAPYPTPSPPKVERQAAFSDMVTPQPSPVKPPPALPPFFLPPPCPLEPLEPPRSDVAEVAIAMFASFATGCAVALVSSYLISKARAV